MTLWFVMKFTVDCKQLSYDYPYRFKENVAEWFWVSILDMLHKQMITVQIIVTLTIYEHGLTHISWIYKNDQNYKVNTLSPTEVLFHRQHCEAHLNNGCAMMNVSPWPACAWKK